MRGDIATVVLPGAYGKPRPAVVVQDDAFEALPSVTVLPLTSELRDPAAFTSKRRARARERVAAPVAGPD